MCVCVLYRYLATRRRVILVNEGFTSQRCHCCRGVSKLALDLATRRVTCGTCGWCGDKDDNAAVNIADVWWQWAADGSRPAHLTRSL